MNYGSDKGEEEGQRPTFSALQLLSDGRVLMWGVSASYCRSLTI